MQQILFRSIAVVAVAVSVAALAGVYAQAQGIELSDKHRKHIQANCQTVRSTMSRLHANDGPTYVNRNQTYFSISDKLIARFNGRLALSSYDMTQFARLARDYNAALSNFRIVYGRYDDAMSRLVKLDCQKQPEQFYNAAASARERRTELHEATAKINDMIQQYGQAVTLLSDQMKEGSL